MMEHVHISEIQVRPAAARVPRRAVAAAPAVVAVTLSIGEVLRLSIP